MANANIQEGTVVDPARLTLDAASPRHYHPWGKPTQEWLTEEFLKHEVTGRILTAMAAGGYIAPSPLLAVEEGGHTVVIDGNRRLTALRQHAAEQKRDAPPTSIILMEDRDQAMRQRILRERAQGSLWTRLGHALHYRTLRQAGIDNSEIYAYYGHKQPPPIGLGADVDHLVQAVDLLDKANALTQDQWNRAGDFQRLARALTISQVRERLQLQPAREHQSAGRHSEETLEALLELMTLLCGRRGNAEERTAPAFRSLEEIDYLREILENEAMTARLLDERRRASPHRIVEEGNGRYGYSEISWQLHELKARAQTILQGMAMNEAEELPYPADLHVASVSYEVHERGEAQFRVLLAGFDAGPNTAAADFLERELSSQKGSPCRVTIASAATPPGQQ